MDKYAEGKLIEVATGYVVKVGKVVEEQVTVTNQGYAVFSSEGIGSFVETPKQFLVTLEVNGVSKLYRELWVCDSEETVAIGEYEYDVQDYYISGLTENDVVRARFEEVEVYTTDAFRAAVAKVAPAAAASEGGGGYATTTLNGGVVVLDKTWKEIKDGKIAVIVSQYEENHVGFMFTNEIYANGGKYYISAIVPNSFTGNILSDFLIYLFETNSENGYPSYTVGGE